MRTTIRLDPDLLRDVKQLSAATGKTMTAIIEEALREMFARRRTIKEEPPTYLTTVSGQGLQPGVDLDDTAALIDLMEEADDPA